MSGGATNGRVVLFEAANGREECSISTRGVQYPLHYAAADQLTLHCTHHAVSTALRGGSGRRAHVHARVGAAQEAGDALTSTATRYPMLTCRTKLLALLLPKYKCLLKFLRCRCEP